MERKKCRLSCQSGEKKVILCYPNSTKTRNLAQMANNGMEESHF